MSKALACTALLAIACDFGGEVGHSGRYGFLPGQGPVSTAPLPLARMLVVESDASVDRTRFYLFEGDLGDAGIGIDDLRKLALGFNRFEMVFTPPLETPAPDGEAGAGGEAAVSARPDAPSPRELELDGESVVLRSLAAAELEASGALRFASVLDGVGFRVLAYFGARPGAGDFRRLSFADELGQLAYERRLSPSRLQVEISDSKLNVGYGEPRQADYLEIDLLQPLVRREDEQALDAGVATRFWPGAAYAPSFELVTNIFEQGCWSLEAPLVIRVTQYAQSYYVRQGRDLAVLERRIDQQALEPEQWNPAIDEARAAAYCTAFSPTSLVLGGGTRRPPRPK